MEYGNYVYRYMFGDCPVYIGRCGGRPLEKRIKEHAAETKFLDFCNTNGFAYKDFCIEYIELPNQTEMKVAESALINKYKPLLNVADKHESRYQAIEIDIKQKWHAFHYGTNRTHETQGIITPDRKTIKSRKCEDKLLGKLDRIKANNRFMSYLSKIQPEDKRMKLKNFPLHYDYKTFDGHDLPCVWISGKRGEYYDFCAVISSITRLEEDSPTGIAKVSDSFPNIGACKALVPIFKHMNRTLLNELLEYDGYKEGYVPTYPVLKRFFEIKGKYHIFQIDIPDDEYLSCREILNNTLSDR